jgi:hypothetical protein
MYRPDTAHSGAFYWAAIGSEDNMASNFNDRQKGFEAKFQHDQETEFKITARRNKLLGLWAAERMDIVGADADSYAKAVVASDFEEPGDGDVVRKVIGDLSAKGIEIDERGLRKEMDRLEAVARGQILAG